MKIRKNSINIFIFISSIISFITTLYYYYNFSLGYNIMIVFPLVFLLSYTITIADVNIRKSIPITTYSFLFLQWLRYVLMPPIIAMSGEQAGTFFLNPEKESLYLATIIMLFDLIFNFTLISFLNRKNKWMTNLNYKNKVKLSGNKYIYFLFIVLALLIYLTIGIKSKMISFLFINVNEGSRIGDITNTLIVISRQIVLIAVFLVFIWTVDYCSKKYNETNNKKYFYISIVFALINVSIIIGERRTAQVYTAFCAIWILVYAYPKFKRKIFIYVGGLAIFMLSMMSIYKFSSAFIYGSYSEAIKNSSFDIARISQILQSYFAGPQDIAVIVEFKELYKLNLGNLVYDFMRSTVPISFFVKGMGDITSELFNLYIYNGKQATGHLISTAAYSYLYLGILFSWLFTSINILMAYYAEKKLNTSKTYEMMYVWAYMLIRFTFSLMTNTPALISSTTIMLVTAGLLFKFAEALNKIKKG